MDKNKFENKIFLAPMAGVSDCAFRYMTEKYGADGTYSEMISAKALVYQDRKSKGLARRISVCDDALFAVQLFGRKSDIMKEAAYKIGNCDYIDINCGCPAPKIAKNGEGSELMKEPALIGKLIRAVKSAGKIVTIKMRAGTDEKSINCIEIAKIAEDSGASAVMLHPRLAVQQYRGHADWSLIEKVKQSVKIPVIGNGDILSGADAKKMIKDTGCDAVAIGRAAWGAPWIFRDVKNHMADKAPLILSAEEKMADIKEHFALMEEDKGTYIAALEARKHACWYIHGLKGAAVARESIMHSSSIDEIVDIIERLM